MHYDKPTTTILVSAAFFALVAIVCSAAPPEETAFEEPIQLIFGYRYPSFQDIGDRDDAAGSFMANYLERYLSKHHDLHVDITFLDALRHDAADGPYWFAQSEQLRLVFSVDECPVHALSLGSAAFDYRWDGDKFLTIDRGSLAKYARNYYHGILLSYEKLYHLSPDRPLYRLPGSRYYLDRSAFHFVATEDAIQRLDTNRADEITFAHGSAPRLYHAGTIQFDTLDSVLKQYADEGKPPLLAWNNFDYSFAPLYSAFGLSTAGNPLIRGVSVYEDPSGSRIPAQISPPFRKVVEVLAEWYARGVIHREFNELTYANAVELAKTGDFLFFSSPLTSAIWPSALFRNFASDREGMVLFQVDDEDNNMRRSVSATRFQAGAEAYTTCVTDNMLEPLLRIFEYTRWPGSEDGARPEGWTKRVLGNEGEHYYSTDNGPEPYFVYEVPALLEYRLEWKNELAMWHFKRYPEITLSWNDERAVRRGAWYLRDDRFDGEKWVRGNGEGRRFDWDSLDGIDELVSGYPYEAPLLMEAMVRTGVVEAGELGETVKNLGVLTETRVLRWITGNGNVGDEWEEYVQRWRELGGADIEKAIEALN